MNMRAPTHWPAEDLWLHIAPVLPGFSVEIVAEIDSTNAELMRRARAGRTEPTLLVAERQSAGRGRLGRPWHGAPSDALLFSLALPFAPQDWSGLSLAVGLSLAQSLHPGVGIKWPNDLWWQGRKLAGVLTEVVTMGARSQLVLGVGINVALPAPEGLSTPPAAVQEWQPDASAAQILARVALPLVQALQAFEVQGFAPLCQRFASRDVLQGRTVWAAGPAAQARTEGLALGVTASGALRLQTPSGVRLIDGSEISVRPHGGAGPLASA